MQLWMLVPAIAISIAYHSAVAAAASYEHNGATYSKGFLATALYASADSCSDSDLYYMKIKNLGVCYNSMTMLIDLNDCEKFVVVHYSSSDCAPSSIVSYSEPASTSSLDPTRSVYNTCTTDSSTGNEYKQSCSANTAAITATTSFFGTDYFTEEIFSVTEANSACPAAGLTAKAYYSANTCFQRSE
jgi:hypothetical protein